MVTFDAPRDPGPQGQEAKGCKDVMKGKEVLRIIKARGGEVVRQSGSHVRVKAGKCSTTVPVHAGEDLGPGLLRSIEKDLEPCFGPKWLLP